MPGRAKSSRKGVTGPAGPLDGSSLPFFQKRTRTAHDGTVTTSFTCQRSGCKRAFYIDGDWPMERLTAPCPHCFKVSRLRGAVELGAWGKAAEEPDELPPLVLTP
jgi:hypothetical protein